MKKLLPLLVQNFTGLLAALLLGLLATAAQAQRPFITTWKTSGVDEIVTIPVNAAVSGYNYTVAWGDGTTTTGHAGNAIHTYAEAGTYTVSISGSFPAIHFKGDFRNVENARRLLAVEQWGDQVWQGMIGAFYNCGNLTAVSATDGPLFAAGSSLEEMFSSCTKLNSDLDHWDLTQVVKTDYMFLYASSFNGAIGQWVVSKVTSMEGMFMDAKLFDTDITGWDVSKVTNMKRLFFRAEAFNQPIGGWDVSNVTNMQAMFERTKVFNQDIGRWNVGKVTDMSHMFQYTNAFNHDIGRWDVSAVQQMVAMFADTDVFNQDIGDWDVSNVRDFSWMFSYAKVFDQDLDKWNVRQANTFQGMFRGAERFNGAIDSWKFLNASRMDFMFELATRFNRDISAWDVSGIGNMERMFNGAASFNQDLGGWNISHVYDMRRMLDNTGLLRENYDATLVGWAGNESLRSDIVLGAASLRYCQGETARQRLIDDFNWTFGGDSKDCSQTVSIEAFTGETFTVPFFASDAVQQLKQIIEDMAAISVARQRLLFGGTVLEDGRTMEDYAIQHGSILQLESVIVPDVTGVLYVDSTRAVHGDGSSWEQSLRFLSDATLAAQVNDDVKEIHVAKGTYFPTGTQGGTNRDSTFAIVRGGLKLYGGYPAGGGTRNVEAHRTVLSGNIGDESSVLDNSYHVMVIARTDADSVVVDGFTVAYGNADGGNPARRRYNNLPIRGSRGGGVSVIGAAAGNTVIRFCTIMENKSEEFGGGISIEEGSSFTISDCRFIKNITVTAGGALGGLRVDQVTVMRSFFQGNYAAGGGAVSNRYGGAFEVSSCVFSGNSAVDGGAILAIIGSYSRYVNSLFSGNKASNDGGALHIRGAGDMRLINCTIAGNNAARNGGAIISSSATTIDNSIIYGNSTGLSTDVALAISNSLVEGYSGGVGNVDVDPLFMSPVAYTGAPFTEGDYRLQGCSPAINRADDASLPSGIAEDAAGQPRIAHSVLDMGALEYQETLSTGGLAFSDDESIRPIDGVTEFHGNDEACRLIAKIEPTGTTPVSGNVTARVSIDPEVAFHNSSPYVQRHYVINATETGTARVTLYFSQDEFDRFNEEMPGGYLPTGPADNTNKANLRVYQFHGQSGSAPSDYAGSLVSVITPVPDDIVWNDIAGRWEVTFGVSGFSGFFVGSVDSPLPVKLVSFSGEVDSENSVVLRWEVAEQEDIQAYEVEYSSDGLVFERVGTVPASLTKESRYVLRHIPRTAGGIAYYRLHILETDGGGSYSNLLSVRDDNRILISVFPVPTHDWLHVKGKGIRGRAARLMNVQGGVLQTVIFSSDYQSVDISKLSSGMYFLRFDDGALLKILKK